MKKSNLYFVWWNKADKLIKKLTFQAKSNPEKFHENYGQEDYTNFCNRIDIVVDMSSNEKHEIKNFLFEQIVNISPFEESLK